MKPWHALGTDETLVSLGAGTDGLSEEEAARRLAQYGENRLQEKEKKGAWAIFLDQFSDPLVRILIAAAVVSYGIGYLEGDFENIVDAMVIMAIVVLNAAVGFFLEFRAEKAMEALKRMSALEAKVVRSGKPRKISAPLLVPGDILLLEEGERVPADCRILSSVNLRCEEAPLTGESAPVGKMSGVLPENTPLAERKNLAFSGTHVSFGRGLGVVVATGMSTEFGKIATLVQGVEEERTPLMQSMEAFGGFLGKLVLLLSLLIFVAGLIAIGFTLENALKMFFLAVSLAVAAVPEGLPIVITITLAIGMAVMAKNKAAIRKITAVETLGATAVICSDKTGTLTRNEMSVQKVFCDGREWLVSGAGYAQAGSISDAALAKKSAALQHLLKSCVLCNNAFYASDKEFTGDPTEIGLLVLGAKAGVWKKELEKSHSFQAEIPFSSERKRMSVLFAREGTRWVYAKGSVESLLSVCTHFLEDGKIQVLSEAKRSFFLDRNSALSREGLRVLGFAFKELGPGTAPEEKNIEAGLIFAGMAGMLDAARPEAKEAIALCRKAGIGVKMITGDHPLTALAVAGQLGLGRGEGSVATGLDLDGMSDAELERKVEGLTVFARVNPEHKLRIVSALKKLGVVVAMTGDGVNDAPALKRADIGVAMGITGTDVSKEAADMVLTDDNFATLVKAVEEGRRIYANIKGFVKYLIAANTGEVLLITFAVFAGHLLGWQNSLPLVPVQLLWLNLVTDGLPATALAFEPGSRKSMSQLPRKKSEGILHGLETYILTTGIIGALVTLSAFAIGLGLGGEEKGQTFAFTTLILFELFFVFNCRGEKTVFSEPNIFRNPFLLAAVSSSFLLLLAVLYLPFLNPIFHVLPLSLEEFLLCLALGFTGLLVPLVAEPLLRLEKKLLKR